MNSYHKALIVAVKAHDGQTRKYTGEPYVVHPITVAETVGRAMRYSCVPEKIVLDVMAAALMHDVLEDTDYSEAEMRANFGNFVADLVLEVTDVSKPGDGNRATRKKMDREHVAKASYYGKSIKLADLIDNTESIVKHDKDFAVVYLKEKARLLEVLKDGDKRLYFHAQQSLEAGLAELKKRSKK